MNVTRPAPPVSLAEAKAHLRVVDSVEDSVITMMIAAATQSAEDQSGRLIGVCTVTEIVEACCTLRTSFEMIWPQAIQYKTGGAWVDVPQDVYKVTVTDSGAVVTLVDGKAWPGDEGLLNVGYTSGQAADERTKLWILATTASMYRTRESHGAKVESMQFIDRLLDGRSRIVL